MAGADTGGFGARAPVSKKYKKWEEEERREGRRGDKKRGEREIMLVSYYNLNNDVFAICSEGNNVK